MTELKDIEPAVESQEHNVINTNECGRFDHDHNCVKYFDHFPPSMDRSKFMNLDHQVEDFLSEVTMTTQDYKDRQEVISDLQHCLSFGKLHPFGSFLTGLGSNDSDLDLYFEPYEETDPQLSLQKVMTVLKNKRDKIYKQIQIFPNIRVPIVRLQHHKLDIKCDISFVNDMSLQNSKLINFLFSLNPMTRPLTILLRQWAKSHKMVSTKGLKSYAIVLLVICRFVRKKMLPSISLLQSLVEPRIVGRWWNVAFSDDPDRIKEEMKLQGYFDESPRFTRPSQLLGLMQEVLEFLNNIQVDQVLCTLTAEFLEREFFRERNQDHLPESQSRFLAMRRESKSWKYFNFPTSRDLCIQDPFDLGYNVTEFCSTFPRIRRAIGETISLIQSEDFKQNFEFAKLFIPGHSKYFTSADKNKFTSEINPEAALMMPKLNYESHTFVLKPTQHFKTILLACGKTLNRTADEQVHRLKMLRIWYQKFCIYFKSVMGDHLDVSKQTEMRRAGGQVSENESVITNIEPSNLQVDKDKSELEEIKDKLNVQTTAIPETTRKETTGFRRRKYDALNTDIPSEDTVALDCFVSGSARLFQTEEKKLDGEPGVVKIDPNVLYEISCVATFALVNQTSDGVEGQVTMKFYQVSTQSPDGDYLPLVLPMNICGPKMEQIVRSRLGTFVIKSLPNWLTTGSTRNNNKRPKSGSNRKQASFSPQHQGRGPGQIGDRDSSAKKKKKRQGASQQRRNARRAQFRE